MKPLVVQAGVPSLIPEVMNGLSVSNGIPFLLQVIFDLTKEASASLPVTLKSLKSIRIATRKRPIDSETIEKFISKIVRNLEGLGESEIPTPTIGKFIMEGLSNLDKVAYVRFASVYKNFKEAKDFEQFVGNLDEKKS